MVIGVMFTLMLTTSYAWYSYEKGSTSFNAVTNNNDIVVSYQRGEYINTDIAVPIKVSDVDQYSDKNNFNVRVKNNVIDNEMIVTVSLVDISISSQLQNPDFKIELYHQGIKVADTNGEYLNDSSIQLTDVVLDNNIDNIFEFRVYILDSGSDQSSMMGQVFQAKIQVDVVSRLKTSFHDWDDPDIHISAISIDGKSSDHLPTDGLYDMVASCSKGSQLTWNKMTKTITYASGSKINDSCSLNFTKSTDRVYLNQVEPGSYVRYVGANGCDGKTCEGQNANYVNDSDMGYCYSNNFKFLVNGWRVAYIKDDNTYLISAGSMDCLCTNSDGTSSSSCSSSVRDSDTKSHYDMLNKMALKYCNEKYAYNGTCDINSVWAMNDSDFQNIIGTSLSSNSCVGKFSDKSCGYTNDLIDNGGYYWFADSDNSSSNLFFWMPFNIGVSSNNSSYAYGVRPVLRLAANIVVVGGSGTYQDPYIIKNS